MAVAPSGEYQSSLYLSLRATTKSLTFPPLSIARHSFIQLSQLGRQWRERKCPIFETVAKGDSNPFSLYCESGILPLSYRAPLNKSNTCPFCLTTRNFGSFVLVLFFSLIVDYVPYSINSNNFGSWYQCI